MLSLLIFTYILYHIPISKEDSIHVTREKKKKASAQSKDFILIAYSFGNKGFGSSTRLIISPTLFMKGP